MEKKQEKLDQWAEVQEKRDEVNYVKWENKGTEVTGVLKEIFDGKESTFAKVDTGADKLTMFSVPSILGGKLKGHIGETLRIVYVGQVKFKSGRSGKDFQVFSKEGAVKEAKPSSSDKEGPFA